MIHYFDGFYPASGGVEAYIRDIARVTSDPGLVITDAVRGLPQEEIVRAGFEVRRVGPENSSLDARPRLVNRRAFFPARFLADVLRTRKKLGIARETRSRILQAHGLNIPGTAFRLRLERRPGTLLRWLADFDRIGSPKIATVHGLLSRTSGNRFTNLERSFYGAFDHLACVDRSLIRFIEEEWAPSWGHACLHWCPNAVDTKFFTYADPNPGPAVHVGFVGRLERSRGIDALATLARSLPAGSDLRVAGAGNARDLRVFRDLVPPGRVKLSFNATRDDVRALLQSVDVLFNPVLVDGISRASLEALATGRPVAMFAGEDRHRVVPGHTGFLLERTDEAVASWARSLPARKEELASLGLKGRDLVAREYSLDPFGQRIRDLYRHVEQGTAG